jgi:protein arginine N-methyltransferase 1
MALVLTEHHTYVSDPARMGAFTRAVDAVVRPGDTVVDLGSGTGILALLACRAGARRVYCLEAGDIISLARDVGRANGFADRLVFLRNHSSRIDLPERADVLLGDPMGRFGFEAGLLDAFVDARNRFLEPGARLIPQRISLNVALVGPLDERELIEFWGQRPSGFDFTPARQIAANTGFPVFLAPGCLLSDPLVGLSIAAADAEHAPVVFEVTARAARRGELHGIGGWFDAELAPGVRMTNSPLSPDRITRRNVFFPIDTPVMVAEGDPVRVRMHIRPADVLVTWHVDVRGGERTFRHSTMLGKLLWQDDLRRTHPGFVPHLTPWGAARQAVLELCTGQRALRDIETAFYDRHRDLFRSFGDAQRFVAEVVTRYSD